MRKLLAAFAVASALPMAAGAQDAAFDEAAIYAKAQEEGELTWYVGQFVTEVAEEIGTLFAERYPGVQVNVIRASGGTLYSRLHQDLQAGVAQCDVFSPTDLGHAVELKEAGNLQQFTTANDAQLYQQFQNFDPDGYWVMSASQPTMMIYNTTLLAAEDAPKSWAELVEPEWQDKLAFGHPAYSGTMGALASSWVLLFGDDYIQKLADLNAQIGRSMSDPVATVSLGERAVGTGAFSVVHSAIAAGNPLAVAMPEEGVLASEFPTAIPVNAPHPNAARLFVNFLQSEELGSLLAAKHSYIPINSHVSLPEGMPDPNNLKAFDLSMDDISAGVLETIEIWRDAFGA